MIRTQMYLTEQQYRSIARLAQKEKKSAAEITRELLDEGLSHEKQVTVGEAFDELVKLGEKYRIRGPKDLSTNVDKYLYDEK